MARCLVLLAALGGCYMEAGLGGVRGGATAHGSVGLILHLGESASVRAGAGGAIGPFRPKTGEAGSLSVAPVTIGGEARILGSKHDSLVASLHVDLPVQGHLHVPDFERSEPATTLHAFVGPGYHHDWWQKPKKSEYGDEERIAGAITTALGMDVWYGDSSSAARASSTQFGASFSLMIEMRAWVLGEFFDCLSAKKDTCD